MFGFRRNPKQAVEDAAHSTWDVSDAKGLKHRAIVRVEGRRPTPLECREMSLSEGTYLVTCTVDGTQRAQAHNKDWRKAYTALAQQIKELKLSERAQRESETHHPQ